MCFIVWIVGRLRLFYAKRVYFVLCNAFEGLLHNKIYFNSFAMIEKTFTMFLKDFEILKLLPREYPQCDILQK